MHQEVASMGLKHDVNKPKKPVGTHDSNPEKVNSTHYDWENNQFPQVAQPNKKGMAARSRIEFCEHAQAWIARYLRMADRFFSSSDDRTPDPA
jgi:hypothetical protein